MTKEIFLQSIDVHKTYHAGNHTVPVLEGVDLKVFRNEWVAILGASGSGKTTLLNTLGALEKPDKGNIICGDYSYAAMNDREKAQFRLKKIGFVFQAYHMFPELSILENVRLPAMINKKTSGSKKRAGELLEQVGLGHRISHKPAELSGGEQQRAAIARALINSPDLILADEPTGNLDSLTGTQILDIFKQLHSRNEGRTIIMITHDMSVADYADRRIVLKDGRMNDDL
jgi:ABC-type lipoprotein export system ATPase subunit